MQVSADKEALSLAVLMAKRLEEGKDGFTAASWQKVETALTEAEALMEDPYAAQADVNRVFGELLDACTSLESGIAKAALKAVIDSTEALLADENLERLYTSDSIQVLKNALDEAKTVYETTTEETPDGQKKINEATNKLIEASTQLLDRNFTALDTLIAKVEKMLEEKDKYTTSTADALEMALNEAKIVAGKDTATGDEIRKAHLDLTEAVTGLEYRGNKAELENAIKTAEKMLSEKDRYVSSTLAGLEAVLNSAKDVFESNDVNQDTVDEAAAALAVECAKARLLGDVNLDGTVDSADSAELLRYCVDLISLTEEQLQAADVNTDDSQDTADASLILQYASEKIDRF